MSETVSSTPPAGAPVTLANPVYALPLAAAAFEVIGSIGPWAKASVGGLTESGIHGGGKATLALAAIIITLVVLAYRSASEVPFVRLLINAVLVVVIGFANVSDVKGTDTFGTGITISVGWGLWLTIFGGILMAGAVARQKLAR